MLVGTHTGAIAALWLLHRHRRQAKSTEYLTGQRLNAETFVPDHPGDLISVELLSEPPETR
jgi:hypothetical protein